MKTFFIVLTFLSAACSFAQKPNVVLILIDDLGHYGVTAYGADRIGSTQGCFEDAEFSTPRMDGLAESGLLCEQAYAYPLCEPSRIALMSGKNNARNFLRPKAQHESDITFGDIFKRAGYATCIAGKWKQSRGTREIPGKEYVFEFGWDEFCCFDVTGEGRRMIEPFLVVNGKPKAFNGLDPETGRRWYGPDIFNRYALDFIERNRDKPFFLYYPMVLVHDEHTPTPDTQPASAFDAFDIHKPGEYGKMKGDERKYFPDMLAYTDKMIGNVLDRLDELGLAENTLVVVMGDNGTKECFTHLLPDGSVFTGGKGHNRENGLHVPLLLRWTNTIPAGRRYGGLVNLTDINPTLCEAAGIGHPHPEALDGISFWPQATGQDGEHRKAIYTWYNANKSVADLTTLLEYVFDKNFKRYAPDANFPDGRFFDLRIDRLEKAGDREVKVGWNNWHRSGLDLSRLTPEQKIAYDRLGTELDAHRYVAVKSLEVIKSEALLVVGRKQVLEVRVLPGNATRKNVVWESNDPSIVAVDKFGVLTARKPGEAIITAYSWDDAYPVSANASRAYSVDGIHSSVSVGVVK